MFAQYPGIDAVVHFAGLNVISESVLLVYPLGTGKEYRVLNVIYAYEKACSRTCPMLRTPSVPAILRGLLAYTREVLEALCWKAELGIDEMRTFRR